MILRGDGSTGVRRADALSSPEFPIKRATVALMNPPFPHENTDTPVEEFVARALESLKDRGKLAVILPMSLLVKKNLGVWRAKTLERNTLLAVCQLPDELFQPFASATTAFVLLEKGLPHNPTRKTVFIRLRHDGLVLRKGVRVERRTEPNQIPLAIDAILNKKSIPGFSHTSSIRKDDEWAPGAYIESAAPQEQEVKDAVDVLLRRLASFYTRYAQEVVTQRIAIANGELTVKPYRERVTEARRQNAENIKGESGTIGALFDIYYGMKELHSREGFVNGRSLVISPTEAYNGCYGWLEFPELIQPPFVTVAQTGSIGEAFVQLEPCAVNDDCLVLLPKRPAENCLPDLILAAACLHAERWRFTYGRKLTPSRIAEFRPLRPPKLLQWVAEKLEDTQRVIAASLAPYENVVEQNEDARDEEVAKRRLAELKKVPAILVHGAALAKRLARLEEK